MRSRSLRLAAQDVALSRRKQGFESPRERQRNQEQWVVQNKAGGAWAILQMYGKNDLGLPQTAYSRGRMEFGESGQPHDRSKPQLAG
jgi:hypothetical protein